MVLGLRRPDEDDPGVPHPVGVLIVDDQATFRAALRDLVRATPGLTLAGEAECGEAALTAVDRLGPAMVIMDQRMPGIGGVEATRRITARHPEVVVLLTSVEPLELESHRCGADAFLRKQDLSPRTLTAVWLAHGHRRALDTGASRAAASASGLS